MIRVHGRALSLVALLVLLAVPAFAAGEISTEISLDASFLRSTQDVVVNFTMTNESDQKLRILRWETPFDGIEANLFEVARNGDLVPYLGRVYKRGTPQASDYIMLMPGESLSARVELSAYYEMGYGGEYLISFRGESFDHAPHQRLRSEILDLRSNQVVVWIDGEDAPLFAPTAIERKKPGSGGGTGGCSNQQQNKISSALAAAQGIAANAASYLSGSQNPSSQRYTEWFGNFSSQNWNTVESNFQAISDALDNENIEFDCTCNQNYFAYVYPSQPYKIYLCRVFWRAPTNGTDSKAGTIVHEVSHFNVVAGTDDVTYGQASCRNLADTSPNQAVRNADSHEYFAENSPSLP